MEMEHYKDCDYLPMRDWWSYDVPTMAFKSDHDLREFYEKVCDIMGEYENDFSNAVYGQRKLYLDYKSQDQPFEQFFDNYKPHRYDFKRGNWTCIGRARAIKELLRDQLIWIYPDIEKCVYVTTSAICDWEMQSEVEPSEYSHIFNFMAHTMPTIKCQIDDKTAYIIMEIKKRFDHPILLLQNETKQFESSSNVRMLCRSHGSRYVEIAKNSSGGQINDLRYAIFVGGALLNLDGVMKLTCLPFIPIYKYRIVDGLLRAMVVCYLDKAYFRFTRKLNDPAAQGARYTYTRIPAKYFQNTDASVDEFECEIKKFSDIFEESVEGLKFYLESVSKMNTDDNFIREVREFRKSMVGNRFAYVAHLKRISNN